MRIRPIVFWGGVIALLLTSNFVRAAPAIQHWTLANGARVYFVESHELPMIQLHAIFDAGSVREPQGKSGLARLTARMLKEGAGGMDVEQIAATLEGLGADMGIESGAETADISLRSLSDRALRVPAIDVVRQLLLAPTFPEENLSRVRSNSMVALEKERQSPGAVGSRAFYAKLYGTHPYAHHPSGTIEGLQAITRGDTVEFHRRHYVGSNAVLALVGDLSETEARELAQRLLGELPAGEPLSPVPPVPPRQKAARLTIPHPSSQTHLLMGQPGMSRTDPDYFPLLVGNHILGGSGLVSRLSQEIRDQRGLSYSVHSYFSPMREIGPFISGLQTENARRNEAESVMRRTLAEFIEKGPTDREVEAAKKHLAGGFPLRIDSNRKIAGYLAAIGFNKLPLTYLDDFIPRVQAVTREQIHEAFRRRLRVDAMVTVVTGGDK